MVRFDKSTHHPILSTNPSDKEIENILDEVLTSRGILGESIAEMKAHGIQLFEARSVSWTLEHDDCLIQAVRVFGMTNWKRVGLQLFKDAEMAGECRRRYSEITIRSPCVRPRAS